MDHITIIFKELFIFQTIKILLCNDLYFKVNYHETKIMGVQFPNQLNSLQLYYYFILKQMDYVTILQKELFPFLIKLMQLYFFNDLLKQDHDPIIIKELNRDILLLTLQLYYHYYSIYQVYDSIILEEEYHFQQESLQQYILNYFIMLYYLIFIQLVFYLSQLITQLQYYLLHLLELYY